MSKFFKDQFTATGLTQVSFGATLEIEIASSGDGLRHRLKFFDETTTEPKEAEILHTGGGEPYFEIEEQRIYLYRFTKL